MKPDFTKATKETLAKRAGYLCSNPDCRIATVGPSLEGDKASVIGEAAHIHAARPGQARFDPAMSDVSRSEISNAIWLCCNCHTLIDRDEVSYPTELLFQWRKSHEQYVVERLGTAGDVARAAIEHSEASQFSTYPPIVSRLVMDKPAGWEYRLTAELMRALNQPILRKLRDLDAGLRSRRIEHLEQEGAVIWVKNITHDMSRMIDPLPRVVEKLNAAWGEPGEPGDLEEIHNCCMLLRDCLSLIVDHEERLRFMHLPQEFDELKGLLQGAIGSQIKQFESIPDMLDGVVTKYVDNADSTNSDPVVISHEIVFDLPDGWSRKVSRELNRLPRKLAAREKSQNSSGCLSTVVFTFLIFFFALFLFG